MSDKVLTRFADRFALPQEPPPIPTLVEESAEESARAFGILRGVRERALMLELRMKDGSIVAFAYALLDRASFDPSEGIRLRFSGQEVRLVGQSLGAPTGSGSRLFDAITRHRVVWIQEASRADLLEAHPGEPLVESISIGK